MGIVFKVEKDGKEYALKICNTTDDEYVSRFKREIRMMETINNNRIVKIIDKDTKKVLKEIPPEKTLDMIAKVWELAGLMVDEKR